jgi:hypothetical protein
MNVMYVCKYKNIYSIWFHLQRRHPIKALKLYMEQLVNYQSQWGVEGRDIVYQIPAVVRCCPVRFFHGYPPLGFSRGCHFTLIPSRLHPLRLHIFCTIPCCYPPTVIFWGNHLSLFFAVVIHSVYPPAVIPLLIPERLFVGVIISGYVLRLSSG